MKSDIEIPEKISKNQLEYIREIRKSNDSKRLFDAFMSLFKWIGILALAYIFSNFIGLCFNTSDDKIETTKTLITFLIEAGNKLGITNSVNLAGWGFATLILFAWYKQKSTIGTLKKQLKSKDETIDILRKDLKEKSQEIGS